MMDYLKKTPHRNLLEREIKAVLPTLLGSILDVGSQNRRYDRFMKTRPTAVDLVANMANDVIPGDVNALPFGDASFDNVVCLEVLEYVSTPEKAASEISRVLVPGGTLVLSVPFMYKPHGDQLRYTHEYLEKLFGSFSSVDIRPIGNGYSVILDVVYTSIKHISARAVRYILTALYVPFALGLSIRSEKTRHPSGYFIVAKK